MKVVHRFDRISAWFINIHVVDVLMISRVSFYKENGEHSNSITYQCLSGSQQQKKKILKIDMEV